MNAIPPRARGAAACGGQLQDMSGMAMAADGILSRPALGGVFAARHLRCCRSNRPLPPHSSASVFATSSACVMSPAAHAIFPRPGHPAPGSRAARRALHSGRRARPSQAATPQLSWKEMLKCRDHFHAGRPPVSVTRPLAPTPALLPRWHLPCSMACILRLAAISQALQRWQAPQRGSKLVPICFRPSSRARFADGFVIGSDAVREPRGNVFAVHLDQRRHKV